MLTKIAWIKLNKNVIVDGKGAFTSTVDVFSSEEDWQGKGTFFLNKILDNFILTKPRRLWAERENKIAGKMEKGSVFFYDKNKKNSVLLLARGKKKNIDDTEFHSSTLSFLCSSPRSTAG